MAVSYVRNLYLVAGSYNESTGKYIGQNQDIDCRGTGSMEQSLCTNATWRNASWLRGNVPGIELANAPRKDTIIVPTGGYAVIRFLSDNPGAWGLHCHIDRHLHGGMALILNDSYSRIPPAPPGFPKCGNFRHRRQTTESHTQQPSNIPIANHDRTLKGEEGICGKICFK